jgi:hypothetical protein
MTQTPIVPVERVLPARASLSVSEVDAILETAYLATAADGHLTDEENEGFRAIAGKLRGLASGEAKGVSDGDLAKLFERFAVRSDHAARSERIAALAKQLAKAELRELAYKVAFAMSLVDLEASKDEAELGDELIAAFGLTGDRADELAGEVYAALDDEAEGP